MPLAIRCEKCGQNQSAPDSLVGQPIICSYCGHRMTVSQDAPLMPPPLPGAAAVPMATAAPALKANPLPAAALAPARPASAQPPSRNTMPAPNPGAGPRHAPPPASPPVASPPPRQRSLGDDEPVLQVYERPIEVHKAAVWPWIVAAVIGIGILIAVVVLVVMQQSNRNPPLASIAEKLEADPKLLSMLGPRQDGLGYSLQLPPDFIPVTAPPSEGLPPKTESFAWEAKAGAEGAGSLCRIWVIPKQLDIERELHDLKNMGGLLEQNVSIKNKSPYFRLGDKYLAVRALLEGGDSTTHRKGVIYLIVDGKRTLMVVCLAAGPKISNPKIRDEQIVANLQALLDHAVRTIQRIDTTPPTAK